MPGAPWSSSARSRDRSARAGEVRLPRPPSRGRAGAARLLGVVGLAIGGMVWAGDELSGGGQASGTARRTRTGAVAHLAPGDTTYVFGPVQKAGTPAGSGATYVEAFTAPALPGQLYTLQIVNGNANGTNRANRVTATVNGAQVVGPADVTTAIAQVVRVVAVTPADTLRLTVRGPTGSFVRVAVFHTPDPTFNLFGPTPYAISAGTSATHSASFTRPSTAAGPFRLFIVNGEANGTRRVSNFTVSITSPGNSASVAGAGLGSIVREIPVGVGTNAVSVQLSGPTQSFITVRVTATDTTRPRLTITAPAPGTVTRNTSIEVTGTVQAATPVTVTVNGVAATVTSNTSYTATVPLPTEGSNTLTVRAVAGGAQVDSTRTVIRDTEAPALALTSPADTLVTKNPSVTVTGNVVDATAVTVNTNGTPWTVGAGGAFSGSFTLADGANVLTTTATDAAGNTSSLVRTVTLDSVRPSLVVNAPADGSTTTSDSATVSGTVTDLTAVTVAANGIGLPVGGGGAFSGKVALVEGPNTISVVATDAATNATTVVRTVTRQGSQEPLPPDPSTVAPPIDQTVATTIGASTAFLYTGQNPIQTGVAAGTIQPVRAAVIRGKVLDRSGDPLPGATITILDHLEFGQTLSRADGMFDLAVNGGGALTVNYAKAGFLPSQRRVEVPWQDFAFTEDVVLVPLDPAVTPIDFTEPIEVARGSSVTDDDGTRRATLLFAQGTEATMVLPNGSTQPLTSLNVRATEYTVGPLGDKAMPAALSPTSAYTYAVELSADEAISAGAVDVRFSQPVVGYLENFLGLPVGVKIPLGSYDRRQGVWVPEEPGQVVKILSVSGGVAELAVDGTGQPATSAQLAALGVSAAERAQLAELYTAGQTLWRTQHQHFSPWDPNMAVSPGPPIPTPPTPPSGGDDDREDEPDCENGSIIECQNQTLGERLSLAGTPFTLNYRSSLSPGFRASRQITIPVTGAEVGQGVERIEVTVRVAGQVVKRTFPPTANQSFAFTWDGKDAYGRPIQGTVPARVTSQHIRRITYYMSEESAAIFGLPCTVGRTPLGLPACVLADSTAASLSDTPRFRQVVRREVTGNLLNRTLFLGGWDAAGLQLGGWMLSIHHVYDPSSRAILFGSGERRRAAGLPPALVTVAGKGTRGFSGDGGPATAAEFDDPGAIAAGPDGSLYVADEENHRIRRISPAGIISTVAGTGTAGSGGDEGQATSAQLAGPLGVAVGPDGTIYIADTENSRVRRVSATGVITTLAGDGTTCDRVATPGCGDGSLATDAPVTAPRAVSVGPDGGVYVVEDSTFRVRRVGPDGVIATVAGVGIACDPDIQPTCGDGEAATAGAFVQPVHVLAAPDGSLYIVDRGANRVRRVNEAGVITTVAGDGSSGGNGDGGAATLAQLDAPSAVALGPDGTLYIADGGIYGAGGNQGRVRAVTPSGIITTVAGQNDGGGGATLRAGGGLVLRAARDLNAATSALALECEVGSDGGPATARTLCDPFGVAVGPAGQLYVVDYLAQRVFRVGAPLPGFTNTDLAVPSPDGRELYQFSATGRHLETRDALTGAVRQTFGYDGAGRLTSVTDGDGNVTTIERRPSGDATAIVAPFGQRTTLGIDGDGYLTEVSDPGGRTVQLTHSATGLLATMIDPNGGRSTLTYDSLGRATRDERPDSGAVELARTTSDSAYTVALTSPLGRISTYPRTRGAIGNIRRTVTSTAGLSTTSERGSNGETTINFPDGMRLSIRETTDPRFGGQAPVVEELTLRSPGGLRARIQSGRSTVLRDSNDPLSVRSLTDSTVINGRVYSTTWTESTRMLVSRSPEGRIVDRHLDDRGRVDEVFMPGFTPITYQYDPQGRLVQIAQGVRVSTLTYDAFGRLASLTDPLGRQSQFTYDASDRLTEQLLPGGRIMALGYDGNGNLTQVTPPGRPSHALAYSRANRPSGYTPPTIGGDSMVTGTLYDLDRQPTAFARPDGGQVNLSYDAAGRLSAISTAEGTRSLNYSPASGRIVDLIAPGDGGTLTFGYDGALPTAAHWTGGLIDGQVGLSYDNDFQVIGQVVNGTEVFFGYDQDGLLTQAGDLVLTRDPQNGVLTGTSLGFVTTAHAYNALAELATLEAQADEAQLFHATYARDPLGRITNVTETIQGTTSSLVYDYDAAGRLRTVSRDGTIAASYEYDLNGNRTQKITPSGIVVGSYDDQDRLVSYGGTSYTYTSAGELQRKVVGSDSTRYEYDSFGNLTNVSLPNGTQLDYVVDAQNRRIGKRVNGTLVQGFLYQSQLAPVAELDPSGQVVARFVYGTSSNVPEYLMKAGRTYRLLTDNLGSVRLVVDIESSAVVQRLDYDEFGRVILNTNPGFQPFGYVGGLYEEETGLVRFGARDYDPETGRWTVKDPIGFAGRDPNLYAYVANDPINIVDPSGLRGYSGCETERLIDAIRKSALSDPVGHGFKHLGEGEYDFKVKDLLDDGQYNDTFITDGRVLRSDQFGNYVAGYAGVYVAGTVGYIGVRLGGIYYDWDDANRSMRNPSFDWDQDSVGDINAGARRAGEELRETVNPDFPYARLPRADPSRAPQVCNCGT